MHIADGDGGPPVAVLTPRVALIAAEDAPVKVSALRGFGAGEAVRAVGGGCGSSQRRLLAGGILAVEGDLLSSQRRAISVCQNSI